jgi:hypothetical protein
MAANINLNIGLSPGLPGGRSSALNVTATGLLIAGPRLLGTIVSTVTGTLTVNDCQSAPGAANQVFSASVTAGVPVNFNLFPLFSGIYVSALPAGAALSVSFS